jgi:very-short-patch-repair endonuclease
VTHSKFTTRFGHTSDAPSAFHAPSTYPRRTLRSQHAFRAPRDAHSASNGLSPHPMMHSQRPYRALPADVYRFCVAQSRQIERNHDAKSVYLRVGANGTIKGVTESVDAAFYRNGGLATTAELLARGVSKAQLRWWVRNGEVTAIARGVYSPTAWLSTMADDPRRMHAIAVGAIIKRNPGMVASHESAAYLHGIDLILPRGTTVPRVTLTRRPQGPGRSLVSGALIRVATLPDSHVTTVLGIPVTTIARTVMDIARTTGLMEGVVAADSALRTHAVVKVEFAIILEDCAQWKGVVQARKVLDFSDSRSESALESVARVRFAQFRIRPPGLQVNIRGAQGFIGRVDFCWEEYRTIAEADGALKYEDQGRERARAQLARDEKFHDAGWGTFHFTWREIYHEPAPTIDRLRRTFARNRPRPRR